MKYGIWAMRSSASIFGAAASWAKENDKPVSFDTFEEADEQARKWNNSSYSGNVSYQAKEMI